MRHCPNCNKECQEDYSFCPYCGYKIEDENNGLIYHYTSIDALNAILNDVYHKAPEDAESNSLDYYFFKLRATHWNYFNDPFEKIYMINKLEQYIRKYVTNNTEHSEPYIENLITGVDLIGNYLMGCPYIISLSKNGDNLDMWRNYAKNGTGVAIGLKPNYIKDQINQCNKNRTIELYDCRYLDDDTIMSELDDIKSIIKEISDGRRIGSKHLLFFRKTLQFKHPCYISEREKRIVIFDYSPRFVESKFRVSKNTNIPYIDMPFPLSSIGQIRIGPCTNKELNKNSILMQLKSMTELDTHNIGVTCSNLPYRQV